ncbi:swi5-like zinc finger protein [Mycoemilia scoparia]|uniref:Swi5-like zinc finger protein n=1 Tax=Mycoemilia scoparia TaxID=417184 RepID=A0A9W7ZXI4_9FUNG|nr:swi5-like zinc finger protein [Mycoemilia scoparia]
MNEKSKDVEQELLNSPSRIIKAGDDGDQNDNDSNALVSDACTPKADNPKHVNVRESIAKLEEDLEKAKEEHKRLLSKWGKSMDEATKKDGKHIEQMHQYNQFKDIAQMLFGKLAELQSKTVKEVYKDFDIDIED